MRNLLVGLFWLWLFVAIGIYAYRIWRRIARGPAKEPTPEDGGDTPVSPTVPRALAEPGPPLPRTLRDEAPAAAPGPAEQAPEPTPRPEAPEPSPGRTGLFASAPDVAAPPEPAAPPPSSSDARPTVAEALTGIAMPCDLTPLVTADRLLDPYRVAFTTDATAATVGAAIGDELERLGFSLTSMASNQLLATKEDARVTVTIHTDPSTVMVAEAPAYPNAKPGSIVVEFRT